MATDPSAAATPGAGVEQLPPDLAAINDAEPDDRPVPSLGLGDPEAAEAMVQATRLMLTATTPEAVVAAVATFAVQLGGELVPARSDNGSAVPLDIALGTSAPVLVDAEALSVTRMRLEQYLPAMLEDARLTTSRLRHVSDLQEASEHDQVTGLLTHRAVLRQGAGLGIGDVVCVVEVEGPGDADDDRAHRRDDALRALGRAIAAVVRPADSIGRLRGGQIVVLQRDVPERAAAARLRQLQACRDYASSQRVSFSAGVAAVGAQGWARALEDAEFAMGAAKSLGSNQTCELAERPV